jgi:predicted Fe-Mo cluster-binding NifX family protein
VGEDKMGYPERQTSVKRKIAICSFQNRVCPRFDLTHELLIFDAKNPLKRPLGTINVSEVPPEELFDMFAENKVEVVISGGMQTRFQEMFLRNSIDVIWGVTGEVDDVVEAYRKGMLYSGMGRVRNSRSER